MTGHVALIQQLLMPKKSVSLTVRKSKYEFTDPGNFLELSDRTCRWMVWMEIGQAGGANQSGDGG